MLAIIDPTPIGLAHGLTVDVELLSRAVESANEKFLRLRDETSEMAYSVLSILDFRMLSTLVSETLVSELDDLSENLVKNPNIDGYPDLLNASCPEFREDIARWRLAKSEAFIEYPHGGIEVKNTFGTKRSNSELIRGMTRINGIQPRLIWKAHHTYTNNLVATFSDYVDHCPQIVALMYSDELGESDWTPKQNPSSGSTMTSYTATKASGFAKLAAGLRLCRLEDPYLIYFGLRSDDA